MRWWIRLIAAAVAGCLVFTSYEPLGWWPLAPVGIALLCWALRGASAKLGVWIGFVEALACYLCLLPWVGEFVGKMPYIALSTYLALYGLLLGAGGALISRWKYGYLTFPFYYVTVEYVLSHWPFGGFAWVRLAWGQISGPLAALARYGGPTLVTFATAFIGACLAMLIPTTFKRTMNATGWKIPVAGVVVALVAGLGAGLTVNQPSATTGTAKVAAIQGNVPRMGLDFNAQRRAVLANHIRVTDDLARSGQKPDLVIWPENSSDVDPYEDATAMVGINNAVKAVGAPTLVGTITVDEVGDRNTMLVFDPNSGIGDHHYKKYLQPFGEYMPYRSFFRHFSSYVDMAGDFKPGTGNGTVKMGSTTVGVATCYEVAFDQAYRDAVNNGAQILATPTNNATFGFTDMTYQQLAMSRMRAIELDRAVVIAATSGVSAMVTPDGKVSQKTQIFTPASLVQDMPLRNTVTFAAKFGDIVEKSLAIIGLILGVIATVMARPKKTVKRTQRKRK